MDRTANRAVFVRSGAAALLVGALLAGVWLVPSGASTAVKKKKTYSAADCEVIQNASVDSSKGSGGFGKEAKAVADAFNAAGGEVKDKALKKSLKNLASFYVSLSKANTANAAEVLRAKGGKAYANALKEYLNATAYCVSQITLPPVTAPTATTPTTSSSSTTSTSSASTSTSTSTSTPATTTTTTS
jgi:hypothetical protein